MLFLKPHPQTPLTPFLQLPQRLTGCRQGVGGLTGHLLRFVEKTVTYKVESSAARALFFLRLFWRQLHVFGSDCNGRAFFRHVHVRRPENAVHHRLSKGPVAEVIVKMAADEAEGASAYRLVPFVRPGN